MRQSSRAQHGPTILTTLSGIAHYSFFLLSSGKLASLLSIVSNWLLMEYFRCILRPLML